MSVKDDELDCIEEGCSKGYPLSFDVALALVREVRNLRIRLKNIQAQVEPAITCADTAEAVINGGIPEEDLDDAAAAYTEWKRERGRLVADNARARVARQESKP